jgi:GTP cyclohydrolase I
MTNLPDIQKTQDTRGVAIRRVGVTNIKLPIRMRRQCAAPPDTMDTVGVFEIACSLPASVKGTHMSRFSEVLNKHVDAGGIFSSEDMQALAIELLTKLEARDVFIQLRVDYFMDQPSPVSNRRGVAPLVGILQVMAYRKDDGRDIIDELRTFTGIEIDGKTCCPCSREISEYDHDTGKGKGAHAQRGKISILAQHPSDKMLWFEDLARIAWMSFSQPVYAVLKRPDEAHVTMGAYGNPKFVEDVVRDVTVQMRSLKSDGRCSGFNIRVQNSESIHYHDAYAEVSE